MFLEQERDAAYAALADLDLDYELGKLNPGDYERTRNGLLTPAVAALKGLDEAQAMEAQVVDGKLATLVHRRRKALLTCHNCGGPLEAEDKFCCRCGEAAHGRCPKCTVRAAAEDRFCRACGTSLR